MRGWMVAILAAALGLAACQADGGKRGAAQAVSTEKPWTDAERYRDYEVTAPLRVRFDAAVGEMQRVVLARCSNGKGFEAFKDCVRERLLVGFDRHGVVGAQCPPEQEYSAMLICIAAGGYGYEFVKTVTNEPDPAFDWSDPEKTMTDAAMDFLMAELTDCLGGSSASDATECVIAGFSKHMGVPESEVQPCKALTEDDALAQCIGEVYAVRFMEQGTARM